MEGSKEKKREQSWRSLVVIPATDLTTNSVTVFERVWKGKGHDRNGSGRLVFFG